MSFLFLPANVFISFSFLAVHLVSAAKLALYPTSNPSHWEGMETALMGHPFYLE